MGVTVIVATFGDPKWRETAQRAIRSAEAQGLPVIQVHGDSLHAARNDGAAQAGTEWACFLDADDELEAGFAETLLAGVADVRVPSVRYVRGVTAQPPRMPKVPGHLHDCEGACLPLGNWIVVGALVRTELAREVGWRDWPMFEDWDFWLRAWQSGATVEAIPRAVYRAHVRPRSRNRAPSQAVRLEAHRMIARANGVPVP